MTTDGRPMFEVVGAYDGSGRDPQVVADEFFDKLKTEQSFTLWIMVEDDNAQGGEGRTYWSVDHFHSKTEAIEAAEEMAAQQYARTGIEPERLED